MPKKNLAKNCGFKGCKKPRAPFGKYHSSFCYGHRFKVTIDAFLSRVYSKMRQRTKGRSTKRPDLYLGLAILPRDVFVDWSKNHPDFLKMYKRWFTNNFDRKLTPSINRMNSKKGYTLDNMEWLTNSQNCGLSGEARRMNQRNAIYNMLGVNK